MKKETVAILGCGWIGKALAKRLEKTYFLKASVQSDSSFTKLDVENKYILNRENRFRKKEFYETNTLIISLPPRENYLENLKEIVSQIKSDTQLILLSSTSVYPQTEGVVVERDTDSIIMPNLMLEAERLLKFFFPSVLILRLGGLMGYGRVAGKYTASKSVVYDSPVNYVHRDDVVNVIIDCIEKEMRENTLNVVAPIGESKKEIYDFNALKYGFEKTHFKSLELKGKRVSSKKLNYLFRYVKGEDICLG
jgi:nucleoside-diphosphate-sugar epimerase